MLEDLGVRFIERRGADAAVSPADAIHVINPRERAALRAIERGAVLRAAAAGAISAGLCALPPIFLHGMKTAAPTRYWAFYIGANVLASVAEVVFLFFDGLRSVRALSRTAGLDLADASLNGGSAVASALARAALELPNPPDQVAGINPWREASRLTLAVAPLLYKLKITLTTFVVKFLVRRALGRAATRAVLELIAVPVNAAWDALVCWLIIHEARVRVMGPTAAREMVALVFPPPVAVDEATRDVALRAIASAIVRTQDLHPNLVALLDVARSRLGDESPIELDDPRRFLDEIARLPSASQTSALRLLAIASVIDGRLARPERRLLVEAFTACGRRPDIAAVDRLRRAFTSGDAITAADFDGIG